MKIVKNKKSALAVVMLFLLLIFPSVIPAQNEKPVGAIEKIRADYKSQKITFDKYILYKAWAVFKPEKLSKAGYKLSGEDTKFRKDGTPIILEIKRNWDKLSPETQNILQCDVLRRPDDAAGCDGKDPNIDTFPYTIESTNFIVHFTVTGGHATDTAYAQTISDYFEDTYDTEVITLGYSPPPSDALASNNGGDERYDVYIYDLGSGLYGYTCPEQVTTPSYSFIAVNIDYSWAPPNDDPLGDTAGATKVTAAHEFFHAVQFNYDVNEEIWWMETTSTYMEDEVYPEVNDNYNYLRNWFEYCDSSGLQTEDGLHEYGNFIFAKRLSEQFTDNIIKEIWVECQTTNGLTAIDNVLLDKSSSLENEFAEFTKANFFLEDDYVDGADYRTALAGTTYDGVWIEYQYNAITSGEQVVIGEGSGISWDAWMDRWATDYITLNLASGSPNYTIDFNGLDNTTNYLVKLITKEGASFGEQTFSLNAQKDGQVILDYDTYDDVVLVIMNAGDTDTDDPSWTVTITQEVPGEDAGEGDGFGGDEFEGDEFEGDAFVGDGFGGGGGGGKSGCFIATACYGTAFANEVEILSGFRDEYLLTNSIGKVFVNTYYKISPSLADFISGHPALKNVAREMLEPVIWLVKRLED